MMVMIYLCTLLPSVSANELPGDPFIPPVPMPAGNKVKDPGLESGVKSLEWAGGWGSYNIVNYDQYSGNYSMKVAKNASAEQIIKNLQPNTTYVLRAMVKSQAASDVVRLGVKDYGGPQAQVVSTNTEYRQRMVTFTTGAVNTQAKLFFYRDTTGSGAAFGDDFTIVEAATGVTVTSATYADTVQTGETLQMQVDVQPAGLEYKEVAWSVENTTGSAVIGETGLLRGISAGEVIVRATAKDGSNQQNTVTISVYGETVPIDDGQPGDGQPPGDPLENVKEEWKGIVWDPYNANPESAQAVEDAEAIAAAGIKWARIWLSGNRALNGDWNYFDKFIALCKENGIQLVATWNKTNPWNDLGDAAQQQEQVDLLKEAVQRYGDDIRYWEIHNEPNLLNYWNADPNRWDSENGIERGRGSDDPNSVYNQAVHRYVQWLELAHDAIKEVDPTVTVILGGLSEWIMEDFMDRLTLEQAYLYFDEVAFHPYAENTNPVPEQTVARLDSFKEKMSHWPAPHNDKPIWITEIGFHVSDIGTSPPGSIPNDINGQLDEATKAYYLQKTMQLLIQNLEQPRPIFYYIYHEKDSTKSGFGLIKRASGGGAVTYLPAYHTYAGMNEDWDYYKTATLPVAPPPPVPDAPPPVEAFVEPVPMPAGNKVVNPGLETGSKSGWSGWGTTAVVNTNPYSGDYGIRVNANAAAEQVVRNLTPNTKYVLRAMVKSDTQHDPVRLGVTEYGGPQVQSTSAYPEYRQRMVSFTTGATNTQAKIFLYRDTTGSGNAYGDDFALIEAATGITVTGAGGANTVTVGQTLQLQADVQPASLEYKEVAWSVENTTGTATISVYGLLTGVTAGEIIVRAAAKDGSNTQGTVTVSVYGGAVTPDPEEPGTGTPDPEEPGTGTPNPEEPGTGTPDPEEPGTGTPNPEEPGTGTPNPEEPGTGTPNPEEPGTGTPNPEEPGTGTPNPEEPGTGTPNPEEPGTGTPNPEEPGTGTPGLGTPVPVTDSSVETPQINGHAVTVKPVIDAAGNAAAELSREVLDQVVKLAAAAKEPSIRLVVNEIPAAGKVELKLPAEWLADALASGIERIVINSQFADIGIAADAFDVNGASDLAVSVGQAPADTLPAGLADRIGQLPVLEFGIQLDGKPVDQFSGANPVVISFPYALAEGDNEAAIVAYYLNSQGELEVVRNSRYDTATGAVVFAVKHFSRYTVLPALKKYDDTGAHWAQTYIEALSAREIVDGVGGNRFAPDHQVTREQFIKMLMESFELLDLQARSAFSDVGLDQWYAPYIASAEKLKILQGNADGSFGVGEAITRQDMMVMAYRTFRAVNPAWEAEPISSGFQDYEQVAPYARQAVDALASWGVVQGTPEGAIQPLQNCTRAEAAKIIYEIFRIIYQ
jgi:uncharacterized protein YjdB